jgi:hypothetical protein
LLIICYNNLQIEIIKGVLYSPLRILNPGLPGAFWPKSGQEEKTKSINSKNSNRVTWKIPVIDWNRGSKPVFRIRIESGFK